MTKQHHVATPFMGLLARGILAAVVGLFLIIGVIGLVLPIIPGVLFLGLAALLLARLSSRFADYLHGHPRYRRWHRLQRRSAGLNWYQRCKLGVLLAARSVLNGVARLCGHKQSVR